MLRSRRRLWPRVGLVALPQVQRSDWVMRPQQEQRLEKPINNSKESDFGASMDRYL
jgi:hypothetical protein